jgi:nitric oxide reductase activation protein
MEANYYVFREKQERSVVAALLLDMSPSTRHFVENRSIFEHEKYAAYLLAEAMESIGDRFGIYACYDFGPPLTLFFPIKELGDRYPQKQIQLLQRAMPPGWGWSRLAVGLRHLLHKLEGAEEKTKIVFFITDGRPVYFEDEVDEGKTSRTYQIDGRDVEVSRKVRVCRMISQPPHYVRADLQKVREEAVLAGVHLFCITLEEAAVKFMGKVFGSSLVYLPNPGLLPRRLLEIFRKVTT